MDSYGNCTYQLLVQILALLNHILQEPMSCYNTLTLSVPVDADTCLRNNHEYTQVHFQYLI